MVVRECYEPGCSYQTPELPTYDEVSRARQLHVEYEHPVDKIGDINAKDGGDFWDSPALVRAAKYGMTERCSELIMRQADVNCEDKAKRTALSDAARKGFIDICKLLVSKGAHLEKRGLFFAIWTSGVMDFPENDREASGGLG